MERLSDPWPVPHYATLPRAGNTLPQSWGHFQAGPHGPKKVHFAEQPQVQVYEERSQSTASESPPTYPQPPAPTARPSRPFSAPAAPQLFSIPNMAARPYGREAPILLPSWSLSPSSGRPLEPRSPEPPQQPTYQPAQQQQEQQEQEQEVSGSLEDEEEHPARDFTNEDSDMHRRVPLEKAFTPAQDDLTILPTRKKAMFVDSAFFSPKVHPTWEQQVEMAKRISASLSDDTNRQSKGQTMYEKRKKRSAKWVHQDASPAVQGRAEMPHTTGSGNQWDTEDTETSSVPKDKPLLKLVMNPQGHVYDLKELRKQGWNIDGKGGLSPDICSDLVKDLNSPNGKGAQIFAKRKKRAEKWVVDETHREQRKADDVSMSQPTVPAPQPQPMAPPSRPLGLYNQPARPQPRPAPPSWHPQHPPAPHQYRPPSPALTRPQVTLPRHDTLDTGTPAYRSSSDDRRAKNRLSWANYNTAARGWGHVDTFYRPVTFSQ